MNDSTRPEHDEPELRRHDGPIAAAVGPVRPVHVPEAPDEPAVGPLDALITRAENDLRLLRTGGYEHTSELVSDLLDALRDATGRAGNRSFEGVFDENADYPLLTLDDGRKVAWTTGSRLRVTLVEGRQESAKCLHTGDLPGDAGTGCQPCQRPKGHDGLCSVWSKGYPPIDYDHEPVVSG